MPCSAPYRFAVFTVRSYGTVRVSGTEYGTTPKDACFRAVLGTTQKAHRNRLLAGTGTETGTDALEPGSGTGETPVRKYDTRGSVRHGVRLGIISPSALAEGKLACARSSFPLAIPLFWRFLEGEVSEGRQRPPPHCSALKLERFRPQLLPVF